MNQLGLFQAPRPAPPPRQEAPKPAPYVPDTAAVARREHRIRRVLSVGPATLAEILRRSSIDGVALLSQSATIVDLTFMAVSGTIARSDDPEPIYRLP